MCTKESGHHSWGNCYYSFGNKNAHDQYAITVLEDNTLCTVGHLPMEMSRECYYFIRRGGKISVEVTGPRQKSVTEGKGMEIPCILTFKHDDDPALLREAKELIVEKGFKEKMKGSVPARKKTRSVKKVIDVSFIF